MLGEALGGGSIASGQGAGRGASPGVRQSFGAGLGSNAPSMPGLGEKFPRLTLWGCRAASFADKMGGALRQA